MFLPKEDMKNIDERVINMRGKREKIKSLQYVIPVQENQSFTRLSLRIILKKKYFRKAFHASGSLSSGLLDRTDKS